MANIEVGEKEALDVKQILGRSSNNSEETAQSLKELALLSDVDKWGRSEHFREIVRKFFSFYYEKWFRVEWKGLENIPRQGGALLVSNHAGAIPADAPVIMHGIETELNRKVYGLADFWFKTMPFVGIFWNRAGGVSAHIANAYSILHDDQELALVFPEGTKGTSKLYSERYRLRRFGRGGFVETAMKAGVPIIPIAVVGCEEAMPTLTHLTPIAKLFGLPYFPITLNQIIYGPILGPVFSALLYLPAKFYIRVLEPVYFDVPPEQPRYSKARVMDEAEQIRLKIQDALYDMLKHRKNPWFG